jgi:hypothetical protein
LNELHEQRNDRQNEQHVDETAERVGADYPEHPQDYENEKDCPEHHILRKKVTCASQSTWYAIRPGFPQPISRGGPAIQPVCMAATFKTNTVTQALMSSLVTV